MATLVTKTEPTIGTLCDTVVSRGSGRFRSRVTRDAVASQLTREGHGVRKSTIRDQQLHPEYVTDFVGSYHTGFGNTDYQTYWSSLYEITLVR